MRTKFLVSLSALSLVAPGLSHATNITLTDSFSVPFTLTFNQSPALAYGRPLSLTIPLSFSGFVPGFDSGDIRLGGLGGTAIQRTTNLTVSASGSLSSSVQENLSACNVFFQCPTASVNVSAGLAITNPLLGVSSMSTSTGFYSLPSLPPLVTRTVPVNFAAVQIINSARFDAATAAAPGQQTFNANLTLSEPGNVNRTYSYIQGSITGTLSGLVNTIVQTAGQQPPPTSVNDLVSTAFTNARATLSKTGNANPSNVDLARVAYANVINLRDSSGNSTNTAYRDAEYMLRGYAGGLLLRGLDPSQVGGSIFGDTSNDLANIGGPIVAAGYNAVKIFNNLRGNSSANNSGPGPASAPGGMEANSFGWFLGLTGASPEDLFSSNANYSVPIPVPADNSQAKPLTPQATALPTSAAGEFNPAFFQFDTSPGLTVWIDPAASLIYTFSVAGNEFASLTLPTDLLSAVDLSFGTCSQMAGAGQTILLPLSCSADGTGSDFDTLSILGVTLPQGDRFAAGFGFAETGRAVIVELSGSQEVAVVNTPEPASFSALASALAACGVVSWRGRARKKTELLA